MNRSIMVVLWCPVRCPRRHRHGHGHTHTLILGDRRATTNDAIFYRLSFIYYLFDMFDSIFVIFSFFVFCIHIFIYFVFLFFHLLIRLTALSCPSPFFFYTFFFLFVWWLFEFMLNNIIGHQFYGLAAAFARKGLPGCWPTKEAHKKPTH